MQSKLHLRFPSNSHQHVARVPLGTTFQKKFGRDGNVVGTLVSFDAVQDLYLIRYDSDDVEELSWADIAKLLRVSGDTVTSPGAVPPLCVEAPTKMSHATALQLQRNLLTKEVPVGQVLPMRESATASSAGTARKRQKISQSSTSGSDTMLCSGTKSSAHHTRRTQSPTNTSLLEEPQATSAPIRKSPRVHVPRKSLEAIAAQFAAYESSDSESEIDVTPAMGKQARGYSIGSSDSTKDYDTEFTLSTEQEERDAASSSDFDHRDFVNGQISKGKKPCNQKVNLHKNVPSHSSALWRKHNS